MTRLPLLPLALLACCTPAQHRYGAGTATGPSVEAGPSLPEASTPDAGQPDAPQDAATASTALYYLYASPDACAAAAASVDKQQGYPARGVDVGAGIHVGPDAGWTTTYATCLPSQDGGQYAYPADTVSSVALRDAGVEATAITIDDAGTFAPAAAVP